MIERIAFCIKTFERPQIAQACVDSLRKMHPGARIYQADDSRRPHRLDGVDQFWHLGHDVGCSAGRNHLIRNSTEDFVVQIDDDYLFTPEMDVVRLAQLLEAHDHLVLAGGECRHVRHSGRAGLTKYYANTRLQGQQLVADKPAQSERRMEPDGLVWYPVDVISNFWIAKRRLFDCMLWDERLKIGGEHADFFQRLQAANGAGGGMMDRIMRQRSAPMLGQSPLVPVQDVGRMCVAFVPSMWITHNKRRPKAYIPFRRRDVEYESLYRSMWGITTVDRWRKRRN